jgi:hypothetical protein
MQLLKPKPVGTEQSGSAMVQWLDKDMDADSIIG